MTKVAMIDLDGVLNVYNGNFKETEIPPIKQGAEEFLKELSKDFIIEIFTVRNKDITMQWFIKNNIHKYISEITNKKNPCASVFVDDRGINFNGDFNSTLTQIREFKPYWK